MLCTFHASQCVFDRLQLYFEPLFKIERAAHYHFYLSFKGGNQWGTCVTWPQGVFSSWMGRGI